MLAPSQTIETRRSYGPNRESLVPVLPTRKYSDMAALFSLMDPTAAAFMLADSRDTPTHVGALQIFTPPTDAGPEFVGELVARLRSVPDVQPLFLKRPYRSWSTAGQWAWVEDQQFDLDHHVRHMALPQPGRIRELLDLVGRLHSNRLAFDRPLWEFYVIEGLEDGRFATYTKVHHALLDGIAAMRLLQTVLSEDPDAREMPPPWALPDDHDAMSGTALRSMLGESPLDTLRSAFGIAADVVGVPSALLRTVRRGLRDQPASISLHAPRTVLNRHITGARRFAAEDWSLDRMKALARMTSTTVNDVVLATCGGALRRYLLELGGLPDHALVANVPVGLRAKDVGHASTGGGNALGSIMVKLGTDLDDPAERLAAIQCDMVAGKRALAAMTPLQIAVMAALGNASSVIQPWLKLDGHVPPPYNVMISNVPGPRRPLYLNGARLDGTYPVSVPVHGAALNITCASYLGNMAFGYTGCRRTVPHLQRLLVHTENELAALEKAAAA